MNFQQLVSNITNNKIFIYKIVGIVVLIVVLISVFVVFYKQKEQKNTLVKLDSTVLRETEGIVVDYLISPEDGEKAVFARYRLIDESGEYENIGSENVVNISRDNAEVFLTYPDGMREEITSENWFITLSIIPPAPQGDYLLTFKLNTGEEFEKKLEFQGAEEVEFVLTDITRTEEFLETESTGDPLDRESRELRAVGLRGIDLTKATSVFHIDGYGVPYGGNMPVPNVDEYFWIDLEFIKNFRPGKQIFMAKIDSMWYYATVNYPEDF